MGRADEHDGGVEDLAGGDPLMVGGSVEALVQLVGELMTFTDEAARQRYLPHSEHDALKAIFRPVLERIIVLDYTLQAGDAASI